MGKGIVSGALALFLVAVLGYQRFGAHIDSPREALQDGINSVKKSRTLTNEEEQYLRVQLAIVDYSTKNLRPPDALNDLIPTYFDTVPLDPLTNQQYRYIREGARYRLEAPGAVQTAKADSAAAKAATAGTEQGQNTGVVPPEQTAPEDEFLYDPAGKRDPFRPFDLSGKSNDGDPNLTPLERYTLAQLRLTATAKDGTGNPTALVEDDAGKGFTVKIGTKIGSNSGVVIAIEPQLLKILERKVDIAGVESEAVVEMKIQGSVDDRKKGRTRPKRR